MRKFGTAALLAFVVGGAPAQDARLEDRVKATFIFNFIQYSDWPRAVISAAPEFSICIVGSSFKDVMEDTVRDETVNGRRVTVRELMQSANIASCQVVYFQASASRQLAMDVLAVAKLLPILTVGETPDFISTGGIVRFTKTANRIRFEINPDAAQKASLSISSRLLRLADIVRL